MPRSRRGRGEGSVYQRKDGRWTASLSLGYDAKGKRIRRDLYGDTKQEVLEQLRQLQAAADRGELPPPDKLTVSQYLHFWLEAIKPNVATLTYIPYQRDVEKAIIPHIGTIRLAKLTSLHVQRMYARLSAAGTSAAMQRKAGTTLGVALQYAVNVSKILFRNVARDVKKPKHTPKEMTVFNPAQVQTFLDEAAADRLYALYVFMLDTGAREYEAFAVAWSDLDWNGSAVAFVRGLEEAPRQPLRTKELKTKKSRRRVALTSFTMDALAEHRKAMLAEGNYRADGPVFCNTIGGWLRKSDVYHKSFCPILERAGLPHIRPYDLRHSSATLLLLAGVDSKIVAERLGHSTTNLTTNTYQHVLPGMQERAAAKLDAIFRQSQQPQKGTS